VASVAEARGSGARVGGDGGAATDAVERDPARDPEITGLAKPLSAVTDRIGRLGRRRARLVVAFAAMALAWMVRFVQDDAFISFRYAHNLVVGRGLVFNPGDRVEGYTNFLWTLLMAVPERLGTDPVLFGQVVSIALLGATVLLTFRLADRVLDDDRSSMLTVLVLVGTASFLSYGTGGLETQLQATLITGVTVLALESLDATGRPDRWRLVVMSLLAGLALLTRLDSAVPVVFWVGAVLWGMRREGAPRRRLAVAACDLVVPAAVLVLPWMVWKIGYYGHVLPNTFVAKSGSLSALVVGVAYVAMFFVSYGLVLLIPTAVRDRSFLWRHVPLRLLVLFLCCWFVSVIRSGGDFMEFRFIVPVLPALAVVIAALVLTLTARRQMAFLAVFAVLSLLHLGNLPYPSILGTIPALRAQVASGPEDWSSIGRRLARDFPGGADRPGQVLIAIGPAGAVPYYSDLPTVDMLGLNDEWVARHGLERGNKPGHLRHAPVSYLRSRGVNLVIGLPKVVDSGQHRSYTFAEVQGLVGRSLEHRDQLPPGSVVVEIPITADRSLAVLYLTPHPDVQRHIERDGWRVVPVV
jgi:arabinofuranosyltransferase